MVTVSSEEDLKVITVVGVAAAVTQSTSTKILYQYIDNIGHLQHRLLRFGLMCSASMGVPFAL